MTIIILSCKFKNEELLNDIDIPEIKLHKSDSLRNLYDLNNLVGEIKALPQVESDYIGFEGKESNQRTYSELLSKWADTGQLIKLMNNGFVKVRLFAFGALEIKKYPNLKAIFKEHMFDNETYQRQSGCSVEQVPVNSTFYQIIYPYLTVSEISYYKKTFSQSYKGWYSHYFYQP